MNKPTLTQLALAGIFAGGFAMGCNNSTGAQKAPIEGTATLSAFQAECEKLGGTFATHDCQGMNTCKGYSYQEGKGVAHHDCAGHSACLGGSCVEPTT